MDQYSLPRMEDIFATLGRSTIFSKIDLRQAFLQLELEDENKELLTIATHKGLFHFNRLAFGVASAPVILQKYMDMILQGIPKTQCLLDYIIVAGEDDEEHFTLLEQVLRQLNEHNLTINKQKCRFFQEEI